MSVEIRPIAESDVASFRACLDAVAKERQFLAQVEAVRLERMSSFVRDGLASNVSQFVAVDDQRVVGWCDILPGSAHALQHCGTLGMGVLAKCRGQGNGITRIELEARSDNERALRMYRQAGFIEEGRKRNGMRIDGIYHETLAMSLIDDDAASPSLPPTGQS